MMTILKRSPIFQTLMIALALTPALLYVYLGQFSRLKSDDYCVVARGQELGAWDYMTYKLNTWAGSYANWFFKGAVAPLDILAVRIMPALIVILWLVGLFWLIDEGLTHLKISHSRRPIALAIAALGVAGAISSSYVPQTFYWYAASTHYTLPSALLTIYLALTVRLAKRTRLPAWGLMAGGALYFITAGASEMFLVFQLTFLSCCLLASLAWRRRSYARIFSGGWLAALVGLMIQLNAPGAAIRAAWMEERYEPDRSLLTVLFRTFDKTLEAVAPPQIFAGFVLLLAVSLLVMLFACRPQKIPKTSKPAELVPSALWLCLIFQTLWLPLLWSHASDAPQFLGRFSPRYMVVIGLNLAFISSFAVLLWQRGRINAYLQRHERGLPIFCNGLLLIFVFLFALTQLGGIYYRTASWLLMTALMFLGLLCWQLSSLLPGAKTRKIGLLALILLVMGLVCTAAIVGAAVFGRGFAIPRILAPGAYLLTLSGLAWGFFLGWLVKHLPSRYGQAWMKMGGLAMSLIIVLDIVLGQTALVPDFQRYAQEWDTRHLDIIAQRDRGQAVIETAPLSYDLVEHARLPTMTRDPTNRCAKLYYSVDSIVVRDG